MRTDAKPADAWWDDNDQEWVAGARDPQGRLVGEVRYWNAAGVLISTAEHVAGKPHGIARRYYPSGEVAQEAHYVDGVIDGVRRFVRPTDDTPLPPELRGVAANVAAYVCIYERGDLIGTTWHDANGHEVDQYGRAMRERPPNIEPTASAMHDGWIYMRRRGGDDGREILESREYYKSGQLKEETIAATGVERSFYENGQLAEAGRRARVGRGSEQVGEWRRYDKNGRLRMVSRYEAGSEVWRSWHRTERESRGHGVTREGAVHSREEVGVWVVRDLANEVIAEYDLGPFMTDALLYSHAVTHDVLDETIAPEPRDRGIVAMIARARRAGTTGELAKLELDDGPAWRMLDDNGLLVDLHERSTYHSNTAGLAHALRWGPVDGELLAKLAHAFFQNDREQAALEIIDAALLTGASEEWTQIRHAVLRALKRGHEISHPSDLDDRARELLEEIRAHPDDDGPRLVFADHVANTFPEHTALIVAQCNGHSDKRAIAAMRASVPDWLRKDYNTYVRGFMDNFAYAEAEAFVHANPDILYRVAPTAKRLELSYASGYIAQLVTMPSLRRFDDLAFNDTYLSQPHCEQLARCEHFEQLVMLGLRNTSLSDDDLLPILRSTAFPKLWGLDLGNGRDEQDYTLEGLAPIAHAVFAPTLSSLVVSRRWMNDGLVDIVARLPALRSLDASGNSITDAGVAALATCSRPWLDLELSNNSIGPTGCRTLAAMHVEDLNLGNNPITDEGVVALATSSTIRYLKLEGTWNARLGNAGVIALASGPIANNLVHLQLDRFDLTAAGIDALVAASLPNLSYLSLPLPGEDLQERLTERFGKALRFVR